MQLLGSAAVGEGILPGLQVRLPPPAGELEQVVEPALHAWAVEGAQIFMGAPPGIGFEMGAVSQSPEVPE